MMLQFTLFSRLFSVLKLTTLLQITLSKNYTKLNAFSAWSMIGIWRDEKIKLEMTVGGDLVLMRGTDAKKLVHTFHLKD